MIARTFAFALAAAVVVAPASALAAESCHAQSTFAVVAHGGALSKRMEGAARLARMKAALTQARAALASGARAVDVVETVVRGFEDSGVFNAGKGAIADEAGIVETDASIMDGDGLRSGAVASMTQYQESDSCRAPRHGGGPPCADGG